MLFIVHGVNSLFVVVTDVVTEGRDNVEEIIFPVGENCEFLYGEKEVIIAA